MLGGGTVKELYELKGEGRSRGKSHFLLIRQGSLKK